MDPIPSFTEEEHFDYQAMLDEAIETISLANAELGPGERLAGEEMAAAVDPLRRLKEAQAFFADSLTVQRLRQRDFKSRGLVVPPQIKGWMKTHRFYLVRAPVTLAPLPGWAFWRLRCWLSFSTSGQTERPKAHDIYPASRWEDILKMEADLRLGLDVELKFQANLEPAELIYRNLAGQGQARGGLAVASDTNLAIQAAQAVVQRPQLISRGEESHDIFWHLEGYQYVQVEEPYLGVVLRVPKESQAVHAQGALIANHRFNIWGAHLTDWWGALRPKVQSFFNKGVPLEQTKRWQDILPAA